MILSLLLALLQQPTLAPPVINFGAVKVGTFSVPATTTLTNPATVVASKFTGGSMLPFVCTVATCTWIPPGTQVNSCSTTGFCYVIDNCPNPLPAGGGCTFSYTFQAIGVGPWKGGNVIRFANGTADTVVLIGSGFVPPSVVVSIGFPSAPTSLTVGSVYQMAANAYDSLGRVIIAPITWTSSSSTVLTADTTGFLRAISSGVATITASSGTATKSAIVTVVSASPPPATQPGLFISDARRLFIDTIIGNYGYKGLNGLPWAIYDSTGVVVRHFIIVVQP